MQNKFIQLGKINLAYGWQKLKQQIWPATCVVCQLPVDGGLELYNKNAAFNSIELNAHIDLCHYCLADLPWLIDRCYQCGALNTLDAKFDDYRCKKCLNNPPTFDRFCGALSYKPPVTKMIAQLKFGRKLECGTLLGELLAASLIKLYNTSVNNAEDDVGLRKKRQAQYNLLPEAIIPIPLHAKRLRHRGFNQVTEILRCLAKRLNLNIESNLVSRSKYTLPQAQLKKSMRSKNISRAFKLTKRIKYKHVAIVDDVFTTGSTVEALSRQLRQAGVEQIDIWCACRA